MLKLIIMINLIYNVYEIFILFNILIFWSWVKIWFFKKELIVRLVKYVLNFNFIKDNIFEKGKKKF